MRIALMTNNYKPVLGGVPISIERLAGGLKALGHEVTIFAPTYNEQQQEEKCSVAVGCGDKQKNLQIQHQPHRQHAPPGEGQNGGELPDGPPAPAP